MCSCVWDRTNMYSLGQIWPWTVEVQRIYCFLTKPEIRRLTVATPLEENSSFWQHFIVKGCDTHWSSLRWIWWSLLEEFVKVRPLLMAMIGQKFDLKFKMSDFLLGLEHGIVRLFYTSGHDKCVYQILCMEVKVESGDSFFKYCQGNIEAFCHANCTHKIK